jgi:hypothetical protein
MARKPANGRKPRGAAGGDDAPPPPPTRDVTKLTPANTLKSLLRLAARIKEKNDENASELSTAVSSARERNHLHLGAWREIKKLWKLSPEKLAEHLEHFAYYLDASGLSDKAKTAPRIPGIAPAPGAPEQEEEGEEEGDPPSGTVHAFPGGPTH